MTCSFESESLIERAKRRVEASDLDILYEGSGRYTDKLREIKEAREELVLENLRELCEADPRQRAIQAIKAAAQQDHDIFMGDKKRRLQ